MHIKYVELKKKRSNSNVIKGEFQWFRFFFLKDFQSVLPLIFICLEKYIYFPFVYMNLYFSNFRNQKLKCQKITGFSPPSITQMSWGYFFPSILNVNWKVTQLRAFHRLSCDFCSHFFTSFPCPGFLCI